MVRLSGESSSAERLISLTVMFGETRFGVRQKSLNVYGDFFSLPSHIISFHSLKQRMTV